MNTRNPSPAFKSSSGATAQVALIDPALGRQGAHNTGFATMICATPPVDVEIGIWGHRSLLTEAAPISSSGLVELRALFSVEFYGLKGEGTLSDHWDWIRQLAGEYCQALREAVRHWPEGRIAVIFHTLSWEHASALALAIQLLGDEGRRLHHMAFLMYFPGVDPAGRTSDTKLRLNFQLAFRALHRLPNVTLFASCSEYAESYAHLLGLPEPLPLHPCFLGDWTVAPAKPEADKEKRNILYLGEIKAEKGFSALPELTTNLLKKAGRHDRFTIQFIGERASAQWRQAAVSEIMSLQGKYPNLTIHPRFWTGSELNNALLSADRLYLSYSPTAYGNKTSGLLWLAGWYDVEAIVPKASWLDREAKRLGIRHAVMNGKHAIVSAHARSAARNDYFNKIFEPFWPWLVAAFDIDDSKQTSV